MFGNFLAVYRFELRQASSVTRMLWWLVLAIFPVLIVAMIRLIPEELPPEAWYAFLFALIPMLLSILGTFMWTTSAVAAEVERESWVYLAIKPGGRTAVMLGKYLAAITWVLPAALLSLTACVAIISTEGSVLSEQSEAVKFWLLFARLACLSVPAYAALYLVLGAIFVKRSMVIAIAYTLIFELLVSMIPAMINKFTIQHRLLALLLAWTGIEGNDDFGRFLSTQIIGDTPPWLHVVILCVYTTVLVVLAVQLVRQREYVSSAVAES
ncbi:MAG: hypothetical protein AAGF97_02760 [Planctomycetota bacterium]